MKASGAKESEGAGRYGSIVGLTLIRCGGVLPR